MNILYFTDKYIKNHIIKIEKLSDLWTINKLYNFFIKNNIDSYIDQDIIKAFTVDWSNLPGGYAEILVKPKSIEQCAIILKTCGVCKIPVTISAGQTNLTGSATPYGGIILSIKNLKSPIINIDINNKTATSPVGIPLELMRDEVLRQSNHTLYYPVDPTSRNDAYVGGTLSCNASGFIPGEKGTTRYWVNEIEFMLINGFALTIKRGEHISTNGHFVLDCNGKKINIKIPSYKRPKIKNASGPYSALNENIDFVDFIIGSEGIFGMITACKFNLMVRPKSFLELFIILESEEQAIKFHQFIYNLFDDISIVTALEYFGHNCQNYMKHKNFFFKREKDVGVYLQVPLFTSSIEKKMEEWSNILIEFDPLMDLENVISLNDHLNWQKFFEARHSIPDKALSKTKELGGVSIITDTIVPKDNFLNYLNAIHSKLKNKNIEYLLFGHLGDCHLHFHLIPNQAQQEIAIEIYNYMIDLSSSLGGVYSAEHGTGKRKRNDFKKCYGDDAVEMVKQSKLSFDPNFVLNRGNVIN